MTALRMMGAGLLCLAMLAPAFLMFLIKDDGGPQKQVELVWGEQGSEPGAFQKPRAITIDAQDRLFIVDKSARIQVFSADGEYSHGWKTPESDFGKPTGLSFDRLGNLMVADTHYYRILFYTPDGQLLPERTLGGESGDTPGKFGWVTDAAQDSHGNFYVSEYGELDRVHKVSPSGEVLFSWGGHGDGTFEFRRPQSLAIDQFDQLWVADACNHRIRVFDASGRTVDTVKLVGGWGDPGTELGQLQYPYDLVVTDEFVYVCEFGNSRIQKFTRAGESLGSWGTEGRRAGQLYNPWGITQDTAGRVHVLDTYNQRVQRVRF